MSGNKEMLTKKEENIIQHRLSITARISETTRFIGFGLMAVYFTIRTSDGEIASTINKSYYCILSIIGFLGALSILLDYVQYSFAEYSASNAMRRETRDYDTNLLSYKARVATYYLKQGVAIFGSILLIILFAIV